MNDRRQSTRLDPIEVATVAGAILVPPLPWRARNDLGNLILDKYYEQIDKFQKLRLDAQKKESPIPLFEGEFPYGEILVAARISVPQDSPVSVEELVDQITWDDLMDVCSAICEINRLESQLPMLDPTKLTSISRKVGETDTSGQKITSTEDSSEQESESETSSS